MLLIVLVFTLAYMKIEGNFDPTSRAKDALIPAVITALLAAGTEYALWRVFVDKGMEVPSLLQTLIAADALACVLLFFFFIVYGTHRITSSK